ncbi:hypothetical protein DIPPA_26604 [Diplonema papillatum]|nr:hypothetical protein DIPPA_26604 [Diplonema papillatum]
MAGGSAATAACSHDVYTCHAGQHAAGDLFDDQPNTAEAASSSVSNMTPSASSARPAFAEV